MRKERAQGNRVYQGASRKIYRFDNIAIHPYDARTVNGGALEEIKYYYSDQQKRRVAGYLGTHAIVEYQ